MIAEILLPSPTLADRFGWLLQCLFGAMGDEWRRRGLEQALEAAIAQRLMGLVTRLRAVFARWQAGTLRPPRARTAREAESARQRERGETGWASVLPRGLGWLLRRLPDGVQHMIAFQELLADAEMQAIIAAAPQVGRILRPFCHLLGLDTPAELVLPKRVRVRKTNPAPTRRRLTPREEAEEAMRRSEATGEPIDPRTLSPIAYGYVLHWPRDDNCPPPEIGYGGRAFPPLPKDYRHDFKNRD